MNRFVFLVGAIFVSGATLAQQPNHSVTDKLGLHQAAKNLESELNRVLKDVKDRNPEQAKKIQTILDRYKESLSKTDKETGRLVSELEKELKDAAKPFENVGSDVEKIRAAFEAATKNEIDTDTVESIKKLLNDPDAMTDEDFDRVANWVRKVLGRDASFVENFVTELRQQTKGYAELRSRIRGKKAADIPKELLSELKSRSVQVRLLTNTLDRIFRNAEQYRKDIERDLRTLENDVNRFTDSVEKEVDRSKERIESIFKKK